MKENLRFQAGEEELSIIKTFNFDITFGNSKLTRPSWANSPEI